ncbi:pre-mRNA-splicing ATP-dependent RNA helicase prp28 [Sorghum bicolor]|nr:pre-mRNA-splicing ATP-dependent RNA helicase prp28 [Sorghum bicolor]|eukprot:XP_002468602.2 pre-mRNA-splicing ATP-dependent RNA helicase prp28 [Sorghum bicolor]
MPCPPSSALAQAQAPAPAPRPAASSPVPRAHARTPARPRPSTLMEVSPPPMQQLLSDSFSRGWLTKRGARAPSLERLVADAIDLGHSFGSSRSFIDMDPAELFSMRWTGTATATAPPESDFDFGLIPGGGAGGSDPPSPVLFSASRVIRDGRLIPSDPGLLQERGADPPSAPLFRSAHSTPASPSPSPSSCSSGRTAGRRGASSWKILLQYLRFLVPLYRKVRALRRFPAPRRRPRVAPASPARASTSSLEWCHGNADTAVRDAILYCKKSSGQDAYTTLT